MNNVKLIQPKIQQQNEEASVYVMCDCVFRIEKNTFTLCRYKTAKKRIEPKTKLFFFVASVPQQEGHNSPFCFTALILPSLPFFLLPFFISSIFFLHTLFYDILFLFPFPQKKKKKNGKSFQIETTFLLTFQSERIRSLNFWCASCKITKTIVWICMVC